MSPYSLLLFLLFQFSYSHINLVITKAEMNRTLGVSAELMYIENGNINTYPMNYAYRIDSHIGELRLTWNSETDNKIPYRVYIESDPQVVTKLRIPSEGLLPKEFTEFAIEYRCAGSRSGQFEVSLFFEFAWPEKNHTKIRLRQEKVCGIKDRGGSIMIPDDHQPGENWLNGEHVFYFIIGAAAAFLGLIAFLLILYFRGSRKEGGISRRPSRITNSFRSSFHSRQPFLTSTPVKSANTSTSLRHIGSSSSPILDRNTAVDVKKCLIELYADRNLFQMIPVTELEGTFGEIRWAIWRLNATGECGDIDDEEDAGIGDEAVIIKTLKPNASRAQFERFVIDCFSFYNVPPHPHLAQVSAAASFGRFENPETVTDFPLICYKHRGFGNLKKFLFSCRQSGDGKSIASGASGGHTLRTHELVSIGVQVSRALVHLHKYGVLHRDIATRNCLVSEVPGAKTISERLFVQLTDCALSRDLFPGEYSCLGDNENRPVKWMAQEALANNVYTSASDIWSFGVLLWELLSCGATPFSDVDADEVLERLERGERLMQPFNCPDQLYDIMLSCWQRNPRDRPNAVQLLTQLAEFNVHLRKFI